VEAVQFCGEDGLSMLGLSGRISNSVYLQEKQSSFVEGFLTICTYRRSSPVCGEDGSSVLGLSGRIF
jgi:hypothetical protein